MKVQASSFVNDNYLSICQFYPWRLEQNLADESVLAKEKPRSRRKRSSKRGSIRCSNRGSRRNSSTSLNRSLTRLVIFARSLALFLTTELWMINLTSQYSRTLPGVTHTLLWDRIITRTDGWRRKKRARTFRTQASWINLPDNKKGSNSLPIRFNHCVLLDLN